MRRWIQGFAMAAVAAGAAFALSPSGCRHPAPAPAAPPRFAEHLTNVPGLKNLGRISPALYRGAMPTGEGLDTLKALGIKTVVNLRHHHGDTEEKACMERGLDYAWIALESSDAPSDEDVSRFLKIVTDPARQPVFFHCKLGQDRTGTFCACYRMAVQEWPLQDALAEMDAFGFNRIWRDLRGYVASFPDRKGRVWPSSP
jgi:protein tyrosine/serine phosphatase